MQIIIQDMPSNRPNAVLSEPDDSDDVSITKYESNGTVTRFKLTRKQVEDLPSEAPGEMSPIPLPMVPYPQGVNGHYWMTPNHVRRMKELVG